MGILALQCFLQGIKQGIKQDFTTRNSLYYLSIAEVRVFAATEREKGKKDSCVIASIGTPCLIVEIGENRRLAGV